jgi:hypothetical protein
MFNKYRLPVDAGTRALVVHTRFATQGSEAFNRNNHPVAHGRALVCHNGVLWERAPRPLGAAEVDTWVLAHSASECETRQKGETAQAHAERIALALAQHEGSAAVAVAYRGVPFLVSARLEGSPLWQAEAQGVRVCASTRDAVEDTFATLGIPLPVKQWQTQTAGKKRRGRKAKRQMVTHTQPMVYSMREGDVCVWHSGTHTSGHVALPDHYGTFDRPYTSRFDTASVYSDSVSRHRLHSGADTGLPPAHRHSGRSAARPMRTQNVAASATRGATDRYSATTVCRCATNVTVPCTPTHTRQTPHAHMSRGARMWVALQAVLVALAAAAGCRQR